MDKNTKALWTKTNKIFIETLDFLKSVYSTLDETESSNELKDIKKKLKDRDYQVLFSSSTPVSTLVEYTKHYVPSRSLCYLNIMIREKSQIFKDCHFENILIIGGGCGTELISFMMRSYYEKNVSKVRHANVSIVDIAPYKLIMDEIQSKNLLPDTFRFSYIQYDVMDFSSDFFASYSKGIPGLITLHFVVNEFYKYSKEKFVAFFANLLHAMPPGTLLWILDSASDVSSFSLNGKLFPIYFLLDMLVDKHSCNINCLDKTNSTWYRVSDNLKSDYPFHFQNIRYFMRVYEKKHQTDQ